MWHFEQLNSEMFWAFTVSIDFEMTSIIRHSVDGWNNWPNWMTDDGPRQSVVESDGLHVPPLPGTLHQVATAWCRVCISTASPTGGTWRPFQVEIHGLIGRAEYSVNSIRSGSQMRIRWWMAKVVFCVSKRREQHSIMNW